MSTDCALVTENGFYKLDRWYYFSEQFKVHIIYKKAKFLKLLTKCREDYPDQQYWMNIAQSCVGKKNMFITDNIMDHFNIEDRILSGEPAQNIIKSWGQYQTILKMQ